MNDENPYLFARRSWNQSFHSLILSRQTWQIIAIMFMLLTLMSVTGLIYIGSQSKFIPYMIEYDKSGILLRSSFVSQGLKREPSMFASTVASFIEDARMVSLDLDLQRKAIKNVYFHLLLKEAATEKMNAWFQKEGSNPFYRSKKEIVNVEIISVLQETNETWHVDWNEFTYTREGIFKKREKMRALLTLKIVDSTSETREEQILRNPLGIYIKDFSWIHIV
jgi:type IV secretion system protein VirB5